MLLSRSIVLSLFYILLLLTASAQETGLIKGDILVMLTPDGDAEAIVRDLRTVDGALTGLRVDHEASAPMRIWLLKFDHTAIAQERMLQLVKQHPHVMMAQNDHTVTFRNVPDDPQYSAQWHHQNIQSEVAWAVSTGGVTVTGDTIVICIIEGANMLHPDLEANRWLNHGEIPNNGIDDDGNGYVDDHRGWNPVNNNDAVYTGNVGHGTNVAGMIGAVGNNGLGMAGANWNVKMMVVEVGGLSQTNVISSYTYPLVMRRKYNETNGAQGAFVVATNASWGIDNADPLDHPLWCAIYDTLGTAGILNCGATANNNVNIDAVGDMPTGCASDHMISVTATDQNDNRTFSGFGATTVDVGAPGESVHTTSGTNGYTSTSGTSFASPLTAGVIGLLYSAPCSEFMSLVHSDPEAGALYVRQMLFEGVDQVGNLPGNTVTGGRINAGTSMHLMLNACTSCPLAYAPAVQITGQDQLRFVWSSFNQGPFVVRYRPVATEEWTVVQNVVDPEFLAAELSLCSPYQFQVGVPCDENEVLYSNIITYEPDPGIQPVIAIGGDLPAICTGDTLSLTSSSPTNNLWSTGDTIQQIVVGQGGIYTVTYDGACATIASEPVEIISLDPQPPVVGAPIVSVENATAILSAEGDNIEWYDTPSGGVSIGEGNSWETPELAGTTSFWAGNTLYSNDTPPVFGGPVERSDIGQYHINGNFHMRFTANESFVIRSVKVYAEGDGMRPIGLVNSTGTTVATGFYNIPDGESRVQLDYLVPAAGQYSLRIMSGNPRLWRDGVGSDLNYPYSLGSYGSITSTSVFGGNATAYYYFFYDWEVGPRTVTCESDRVEVIVELTVGLLDHSRFGNLKVYPNPADDRLTFDLTGIEARGGIQLEVLDIAGKGVESGRLAPGVSDIGTAHLAPGTYHFKLADQDGPIGNGRFVIAR